MLSYIAIAAGAVTDLDLFAQNPVKLPFLNIELPLLAFFALAPLLFLITHAYTLVHFVMLGAKAGRFHDRLYAQIPDADEIREGLRRQLPSNIFVQFLAGPKDIREGGLGVILKLIAWTTLVVGPILLLLLVQIQFLPYHHLWITWTQRGALLLDLALLWALWPAVLASRSEIEWPRLSRSKTLLAVSVCAVLFSWGLATFPGEWQEEHLPDVKLPPIAFLGLPRALWF
jgi:hypothetical protein